jgi:hypothetical protein
MSRAKISDGFLQAQTAFDAIILAIDEANVFNKQNMASITDVELCLVNFNTFKEKSPVTPENIQYYLKLLSDEVTQMKRLRHKEEKETVFKFVGFLLLYSN